MDKKSPKNRWFALFCLSLFIDAFAQFMYNQAESAGVALLWIKISGLFPFSVALGLHFTLVFSGKTKYLARKLIVALIYLPALATSVIFMMTVHAGRDYWGYRNVNDPVFMYAMVWIIGMGLFNMILSIVAYIKSKNKIEKKQLKYLTIGFIFIVLSSNITQGILPTFHILVPELTSAAMACMAVLVGYGIWKYRLFKLNMDTAADNILKTMSDSLVLSDPKGKIVAVNKALTKLLGYQEAELIGFSVERLFAEKGYLNELLMKIEKKEPVTGHDLTMLSKTCSEIPVIFSASVILDDNKEVAGVIGLATDITERKLAETKLNQALESLRQSNESLDQFAHIASHDLQEPLRKISTYADRLKSKYSCALEEQGRGYLDRLQHATIRMQTLIEDLLTYSRITTIKVPTAPVDISKIVEEVLSDLEVRIEKTSAKVQVSPLPTLVADSTQMRQLFQNLIGNALKFHRSEVPPVVKVFELKEVPVGFIAFVIEDNGIGIDKLHFDKIFGVFQRLHGKDEYEGSGIGLAVCKKIAERHGGCIRVESEIGKGTKFIVLLSLNAS
jgi:two-component system sensor kinase FixL